MPPVAVLEIVLHSVMGAMGYGTVAEGARMVKVSNIATSQEHRFLARFKNFVRLRATTLEDSHFRKFHPVIFAGPPPTGLTQHP